MAKQLNLLGNGQIIPTALHIEMERSYLEYAMSVIVGRALPDVRDGLKPVHRRILYAMYELGLTPDRPYRKCARVVGDVLGKYHPHGDQSVYDALVRMVQDFSARYPLLAGHGNFGSVDNDPPAAMRYTETRLAAMGYQSMLQEINDSTVEFTNNFDNSQQEPVVLPAQLPILLLNGCSGIAVGMATNMPPHNLNEVVDGLITLIDNPQLSDEELWQLIPGPDFPTGGEILDNSGIKEAYRTGKGVITLRGIASVEQLHLNKGRVREKTALIITELPYQVSKAAWIEKVAELVVNGKLEGIADLRDESDRTGMRVVVELKKDAIPKVVLEELYKHTPLMTNFGVINLALINNIPTQLSLRQLLEEFLKFREQTLTKLYTHELDIAQQRLHLVEGLLTALSNLDQAIDILRSAADGTVARNLLMERLSITETQADAILSMPLRRLTGLERQKLHTESSELQVTIAGFQKLLNDRHELLKALKKELRSFKRQFGDERRTRIVNPPVVVPPSALSVTTPLIQEAIIEITHQGYIHTQSINHPATVISKLKNGEDFVIARHNNQQPLVAITNQGKAFPIDPQDIPPVTKRPKQPLFNLLPKSVHKEGEHLIACCGITPENPQLLILSKQGRGKLLTCEEFKEIGNRGLSLTKLKEDDCLAYVIEIGDKDNVAIATSKGRILHFYPDVDIPRLGRTAQGIQIVTLGNNESIVGCVALSKEGNLLLVSELGYGKQMPIKNIPFNKVGNLGTSAMNFQGKSDQLVGILSVAKSKNVLLTTSLQGRILLPIDAIPVTRRDGTPVRITDLKAQEKILTVNGMC